MTTIAILLQKAAQHLQSVSPSARLDAELILAYCLNKPRHYGLTWPSKHIDKQVEQQFTELIERRRQGEPVAYIVGQQAFWDLVLSVNPAVLIARPETEGLVAWVLEHRPIDKNCEILDLGTGSGAIALALAKARPHWRISATDKSVAALDVARINAAQHHIDNVQFYQGDWFAAISVNQRFDVIVSNPPYVAAGDPHLEAFVSQFEPTEALISGPSGLEALTHIAEHAQAYLKPGGYLVMEHGFTQGPALVDLLTQLGFKQVTDYPDEQRHPRMIVAFTG